MSDAQSTREATGERQGRFAGSDRDTQSAPAIPLGAGREEAALTEAEALLEAHAAPRLSTAPETLGLSGAISKRLYDLTGDAGDLDRAIRFYERGFHIAQNYYNGINLAFLYTLKASLTEDDTDAIVSHGYANIVRRQVAEICEGLIGDEDGFAKRGDREWVYLTLAEAYQGMGRSGDEARLDRKIESTASPFARASRDEQRQKLAAALDAYEQATPTAARLRAGVSHPRTPVGYLCREDAGSGFHLGGRHDERGAPVTLVRPARVVRHRDRRALYLADRVLSGAVHHRSGDELCDTHTDRAPLWLWRGKPGDEHGRLCPAVHR